MLALSIDSFSLVIATALATYVLVRASHHRPARCFVFFTGFLMALRILVGFVPSSENTAYFIFLARNIAFSGMITTLMLLLASMFMPQWWEGQRPIRWIILPYLGVAGLSFVDQLLRLHMITSVVEENGVYTTTLEGVGGILLMVALSISSVFIIIFLSRAAGRNTQTRRTILLMLGILVIAIVFGNIAALVPGLFEVFTRFITIFLLAVFAYVIVREQAFEPRRQGVRLAMNAMRDVVLIADSEGTIVFVNGAAGELGAREGAQLSEVLAARGFGKAVITHMLTPLSVAELSTVQLEVDADARIFDVTTQVLRDADATVQGLFLLLSDRTELVQRTHELTAEQQRLSELVTQLQDEQAQRSELAATVRSLSLPLIPVLDGVLVLPLIGTFDQQRMHEFKQVLLQGITETNARHVLIDLTGIELVDEQHSMGIMEGIQAAQLIGAECILVGIRPATAQSLVAQSIDLRRVRSAATLREALSLYMET